MKIRLRRIALWLVAALILALLILCLPFDPPKWTAAEVRERADLMNEKAGILTPHFDFGKKTREANLPLFEKVESGKELTPEESATYRVLYQSILKDKQRELALLDDQLTVMTNYMPGEKNNVGTHGIEGSHDHHDASSAANLEVLRDDLARIKGASGFLGSFARVRAAIAAYKDLDDIILHMATAPQTKSVPRAPVAPADELERLYEQLMLHFKSAQFEPVNSTAYVREVHAALDHYDALVLLVQDQVYAGLGPFERSLSGRWSSRRSLAPSLRGVTANRIPRTGADRK